MAPIRYSLHYEDYSEHLMARFGKLLQMQSLVDMTLMCASHTLRVHKTVLAASSAYFQEVLQKQTGEPLIILKMRFTVLKCLIEFMYCGKTQCLEENLDELVSAAQFLKIKGLSKVTKEGLGITNNSDLPVFSPPIVINKPPQSLIDLQTQLQENAEPKPPPQPPQPPPQPPQMAQASSTSQSVDGLGRPNKDMVVRIPFDIDNGSAPPAEYPDSRSLKPRRGRPNARSVSQALQHISWESPPVAVPGAGAVPMGRAAERALYKRELDSRKAIHQLKHMQSRHQARDYMERVSLSQAVSSICGPESSSGHNYMNIENDLMYMDQTVSSNVLDPTTYAKENDMGNQTITSSYPNDNSENSGISNAMSQYVNALKSAGLPTDLPILFESGDGSYINVNEQVLLDMVQSSEIQYEVIEQPNIIEKVADPSEIKSIDDLSKSIERGEMMMGSKGFNNYDKNTSQYNRDEDAINSLNAILPDNLEPFAEQQNFVVLDPQETNNIDQANDFSCIDGDMQFFTKSMSDDVKKYYEEHQLNEARVMEQLCPTSTTLDTNFNISLLDSKSNINQQYPEDLRRNEDCYDFGLQLPQSSDFKEDALDCLMVATPKQTEDNEHRAQERDEIIQDLMNIEKNMNQNANDKPNFDSNVQDFNDAMNDDAVFDEDIDAPNDGKKDEELSNDITSSGLRWDSMDISKEDEPCDSEMAEPDANQTAVTGEEYKDPVIDLTEPTQSCQDFIENTENVDNNDGNKENEPDENGDAIVESSQNDIPFAVGLLPLKQVQPTEESYEDDSVLKRQHSIDDLLDNIDAKCLKRKVKYKKL